MEPKLFITLREGLPKPSGKPQTDVHYTPTALARYLTELAIGTYRRLNPAADSITVLDPACGSGVFLVEAIRELEGGSLSLNIRGVDSSPISTSMAGFAVGCAAEDYVAAGATLSVEIREGDSLERGWQSPDVILMNPPFLPWKSLDAPARKKVRDALGDLYGGHADTAIAFLARAAGELKPGGVLAAVLPATMLQSKSAERVRAALSGPGWRAVCVGRVRDYGYFENAIVEPAFVVLSKGLGEARPVRTILAESEYTDRAIRAARVTPPDAERLGDGWEVGTQAAMDPRDWSPRPRRGQALLAGFPESDAIGLVTSLFTVRLGIRSGSNETFIVPRSLVATMAASERRFFRPVADEIRYGQVRELEYLFYPYENGRPAFNNEAGIEAAAPVFYHARLRPGRESLKARAGIGNHWWELARPRPLSLPFGATRIVSTTFGRRGAFALDEKGKYAVHQGNAWFWNGGKAIDLETWLAYLAILNSSVFESLLDYFCFRTQGGQYELAKRYLRNVPLPNVVKLKARDKKRLAEYGRDIHGGKPSTYALWTKGSPPPTASRPISSSPTFQSRHQRGWRSNSTNWRADGSARLLAYLRWRRLMRHPAARRVLEMGKEAAVPMILRDLSYRPTWWFGVLQELTGADPVAADKKGLLDEAARAWIEWGRENGYKA